MCVQVDPDLMIRPSQVRSIFLHLPFRLPSVPCFNSQPLQLGTKVGDFTYIHAYVLQTVFPREHLVSGVR